MFLEYVVVFASELGDLLQNAAIGLLSVIGHFIIQTSIRETQPVVPADSGMLVTAGKYIAAARCNRSKHMFVIMSMCIAGLITSHCQGHDSDEPNKNDNIKISLNVTDRSGHSIQEKQEHKKPKEFHEKSLRRSREA